MGFFLLLLLSGHATAADYGDIDISLTTIDYAYPSGFITFNVNLTNVGDRGVCIDQVFIRGSTRSNRGWNPGPFCVDVNESGTLQTWTTVSGREYTAEVVYQLSSCEGVECLPDNRNRVAYSNTLTLDFIENPRSKTYYFFVAYGYILLFLFIVYLLTQPREKYIVKSFLLLLAVVNLSTALLDFMFDLHERSFFFFVLFSFFVIAVSIWVEKIPGREIRELSKEEGKKHINQIKRDYLVWSGLWFAFVSLELFVPIFWGLIKPSIAAFYATTILVFFVFILFKRGIVDDRFFTIVTSFVFAFFIINQVTSPIFEPRVNVIGIEPMYVIQSSSSNIKGASYHRVDRIDLQVEPAFLGFLPSFGERRVFNEVLLSLPDSYMIRDLAVEYPCGIRLKEQNTYGVVFEVDSYSANNRFCLCQLGCERLIDLSALDLDLERNTPYLIDEENRTWDCSNVTISNKGILDIRGYRHFLPHMNGTLTCFVDNKASECRYDPLAGGYYISADIESGEEVTLAICVR